MRLELSRRAQADLDDIRDYSVEQFGLERTIEYLDAVEQAFRRLVNFPRIGAQRADLGKAVLTYPVGEHRILYETRRDRVHVIRVLHKAMDSERWI